MVDDCKFDPSGNLQQLRMIVPNLREPQPLAIRRQMDDYFELNTERGENLIFHLWDEHDLGIVRAYAGGGTVVDWHAHGTNEWIGVYQGEMIITFRGEAPQVVKQYEMVYIPANVEHLVEYPVNSWSVAVTMPCAPEWIPPT